MDLSRFGRGEKIAGIGGLVLLASLFLPWFGKENGWIVFTGTDILLAVTAAAAIAMALLSADRTDSLPGRLSLPAAVLVLGVVCVIWILARLANPPGPAGDQALSRDIGIYVGFFACVAIVYGGFLGMHGNTVPEIGAEDQ
jgi:hypothetical protein